MYYQIQRQYWYLCCYLIHKDLLYLRKELYCHIKVNFLWIPYIIFKNTDNDEAVTVDGDTRTLMSVTRQGGFTRSGPEVADEVKRNCKL